MTDSLIIKDGNGAIKSLTVESGSYGFIPVNQPPVVTSVSQGTLTGFVWNTAESGTFQIAINDTDRKGLTVFNPGPNNLFIAQSSTGGTTNGFTLVNTASAPSYYSFILYPSGTFVADSTNASIHYGGYFISGSASTSVLVSRIS